MKPTYEGCHPHIAEALQKGEHPICKYRSTGGTEVTTYKVVAYLYGHTYPYVCLTNAAAGQIIKTSGLVPVPKLVERQKKASEIVKWLEDNGYKPDVDGDWYKHEEIPFLASMFRDCGQVPNIQRFDVNPAWLEEVEV